MLALLLGTVLITVLGNYAFAVRKLKKEIRHQARQYQKNEWALILQNQQYRKARKQLSMVLRRLKRSANPPDSTS